MASLHKPELVEYSESTLARFKVGDVVGELAQSLFVPDNSGGVD